MNSTSINVAGTALIPAADSLSARLGVRNVLFFDIFIATCSPLAWKCCVIWRSGALNSQIASTLPTPAIETSATRPLLFLIVFRNTLRLCDARHCVINRNGDEGFAEVARRQLRVWSDGQQLSLSPRGSGSAWSPCLLTWPARTVGN